MTGIAVNLTVLPENDLRDKVTQEFTGQANQPDVATLSNFEIPIYSAGVPARWPRRGRPTATATGGPQVMRG